MAATATIVNAPITSLDANIQSMGCARAKRALRTLRVGLTTAVCLTTVSAVGELMGLPTSLRMPCPVYPKWAAVPERDTAAQRDRRIGCQARSSRQRMTMSIVDSHGTT